MKVFLTSFTALLAVTLTSVRHVDAAGSSATEEKPDEPQQRRRRDQGPPPIAPEIGIVGASIAALTPALASYETPIQARFTHFYDSMWWNCIAVYSNDWLDSLTVARPTVVAQDESLYTTPNRALCGSQAIATYNYLSVPGNRAPFVQAMADIGVSVVDGIDSDLAACADEDIVCYQKVAADQEFSPEIMGHVVAKQLYDYSIKDGFNELGTDGGCVVSCRQFRDTTGYIPKNSPYDNGNRQKRGKKGQEQNWEPLLEDDGFGFFYYQQHVTPHIGQKASFFALPEEERKYRVASPPTYSRKRRVEAREVIERMAGLNDVKKMQVEVFDDKIRVLGAIIDSFIGKLLTEGYQDEELQQPNLVLSYERFINFVVGMTAAEMDSIIIAWKEKINYDLIRPTSVIKSWGDKLITTWAPGGGGVQEFPARDFEAYIRVMPHSEYVSGSACIFEALKDYVVGYMDLIGLDTTFPVAFPTIPAGSSSVEPGAVPETDLDLVYSDIETMADEGNDSRLDGGMHFDDSVPAAQELCSGIGTYAVDFANQLLGK
mmetsp:Transcript_25218/g.69650  ORF Transcript_25218/g.69650 Transcript_25218/m.69650 type:complete len:545 (+) Transcript_25218:109-1743(+)